MPIPAYIRFTHKGTTFPSSIIAEGKENTSEVHEFTHFVGYVDTEHYSGNVIREHTPIKLHIPLGNIAPRLYECLCKDNKIDQVDILWFQYSETHGKAKSLYNYFSHKLEKVKVSRINLFFENVKNPAFEKYNHLMIVELCYEYVTWLFTNGYMLFKDKWEYVYAYQMPKHSTLTPKQLQDLLDKPAPLTDGLALEIAAYKAKQKELKQSATEAVSNAKSKVLDSLAQIKMVNEKGNPVLAISINDKEKKKVADSKANFVSIKDIQDQEILFDWNDIAMNFTSNNDIRIA